MKIIAIDPGPTKSAWLEYDPQEQVINFPAILNNDVLLAQLYNLDTTGRAFVIEMVAGMGMAVGKSTFETVFWIGRFWEAIGNAEKARLCRHEVKMAICGNMRAKDSNIRQALIDRFEPNLAPRQRPKGILKGISKDLWSALALAVTYHQE
jgi:hypothetical protein